MENPSQMSPIFSGNPQEDKSKYDPTKHSDNVSWFLSVAVYKPIPRVVHLQHDHPKPQKAAKAAICVAAGIFETKVTHFFLYLNIHGNEDKVGIFGGCSLTHMIYGFVSRGGFNY
jgi:hypothetical protein